MSGHGSTQAWLFLGIVFLFLAFSSAYRVASDNEQHPHHHRHGRPVKP